MNLKFFRMRANAKLPVRAHKTDAGMDLFYCPNGNRGVCTEDNGDYWIPARGSSLVSTGLKTEIPEGYMLEIKNKSGIASKRGLIVGACVVDRGYTGEIFVNLHNITHRNQTLHEGDKIAQAVFVKVRTDIELIDSDHIYDDETSRGEGALGSTGDR